MGFLSHIEKQHQSLKTGAGFTLIGVIGLGDFISGYELAFSLFYVLPIFFLTWFIGRRTGTLASLVSAVVWAWADIASGHDYSHPLIPVWNTLIRLSFFALNVVLLSTLRRTLDHEQELARIDNLTGAVNSRLFFELLHMEMERLQRYHHPFTLAYLDLDNFKEVNDQYGHSVGDHVLRTVVSYAQTHVRKVDVIARLGGDEFAVLFPETNQESARMAVSQLQSGLLEEMRHKNWPITFSIGVVTYNAAPSTADELVRIADHVMYEVKHDNKNAVKYITHTG